MSHIPPHFHFENPSRTIPATANLIFRSPMISPSGRTAPRGGFQNFDTSSRERLLGPDGETLGIFCQDPAVGFNKQDFERPADG